MYETVYNMPIWLRRFTFKKLEEHYKKESEEHEKAMKSSKQKKNFKPKKPTFRTKARK